MSEVLESSQSGQRKRLKYCLYACFLAFGLFMLAGLYSQSHTHGYDCILVPAMCGLYPLMLFILAHFAIRANVIVKSQQLTTLLYPGIVLFRFPRWVISDNRTQFSSHFSLSSPDKYFNRDYGMACLTYGLILLILPMSFILLYWNRGEYFNLSLHPLPSNEQSNTHAIVYIVVGIMAIVALAFILQRQQKVSIGSVSPTNAIKIQNDSSEHSWKSRLLAAAGAVSGTLLYKYPYEFGFFLPLLVAIGLGIWFATWHQNQPQHSTLVMHTIAWLSAVLWFAPFLGLIVSSASLKFGVSSRERKLFYFVLGGVGLSFSVANVAWDIIRHGIRQ